MTLLMKASALIGRPVVTLAGEAVAQVKDVIYAADGGALTGFTLNGRGLFAGPLSKALPWSGVHALGRDAVMVRDESVLETRKAVVAGSEAGTGDVLGSSVLTDDGRAVGTVLDVVVAAERGADVVGYEITPAPSLGVEGRSVFVPLPDTLSVSGEALIVPAAVTDHISDDLSGFGASVEAFRSRPGGAS